MVRNIKSVYAAKFRGVSYKESVDKFLARGTGLDGKRRDIGTYDTAEEAAAAYAEFNAQRDIAALERKVAASVAPLEPQPAPAKSMPIDYADAMAELGDACVALADEIRLARSWVGLDEFNALFAERFPAVAERWPVRASAFMASPDEQDAFGFWTVEQKRGEVAKIIFTEQREPVYRAGGVDVRDIVIARGGRPSSTYASLPESEKLDRQLALARAMVDELGLAHERMTLWEFRNRCAAEDPALFKAQPTGFGRMMTDPMNQARFGAWRTEKQVDPQGDDVSPWVIFEAA